MDNILHGLSIFLTGSYIRVATSSLPCLRFIFVYASFMFFKCYTWYCLLLLSLHAHYISRSIIYEVCSRALRPVAYDGGTCILLYGYEEESVVRSLVELDNVE